MNSDQSEGRKEPHGLARWSGARVALLSIAWIFCVIALTIARAVYLARVYRREHPDQKSYLVGVGIPGDLWSLLAPPLVLVAVWLWARRSRPAS